MKVSKGTIIRTLVLAAALTNQILTVFGKNPLPWSSDEVERGMTLLFTIVASLAAWWKNNSFTTAAIKGDKLMESLKDEGVLTCRISPTGFY